MACALVCAIFLATWGTLSGHVHARPIGISTESSNIRSVTDGAEDGIFGADVLNVENLQLAGIDANAYSFPTFPNPPPGVNLSGVARVVNGSLRLLNGATASGGYLLTAVPVAFYNFDRKVAGVFGTSFTYQFLNVSSSRPGDGFTFIMTISKVARGRLGGDLGYANSGNDQCIAIEFDTYFNPEWDPNDNHIGFDTFGKIRSVATTANNTTPLIDIVNGGQPVYVWIQFWPQGGLVFKIQVFVSTTPKRPMMAVFEVNADMGQILSRAMGSNLYVGFTAASMGVVATIDISNWFFFSANLQ